MNEMKESCQELLTGKCRVIIFVQRKKDIELVKNNLYDFFGLGEDGKGLEGGVKLLSYHGGMEDDEKAEAHRTWVDENGGSRVMVCTNAFGTGVDTANVRTVIHFTGSGSLLEYSQEAGRAGRDGKPAECIYIYSAEFATRWQQTLASSWRGPGRCGRGPVETRHISLMYQQLCEWVLNMSSCRKNALFNYLDGYGPGLCLYDVESVCCDVCEDLESGKGRLRQVTKVETPVSLNTRREEIGVSPVTPKARTSGSRVGSTHPAVVRTLEMDDDEDVVTRNLDNERVIRTITLNKAADAEDTEEACADLRFFTTVARRLDGLCIVTLVESNGKKEEKIGVKPYKRCFICQGHHFARECELHARRYQDGLCFKCDLKYLHGFDLHANIPRSACNLGCIKDLAWTIWRVRPARVHMVREFMTESDRDEVGMEASKGGNSYVVKGNVKSDQLYLDWLRRGAPVRNQIRVVLWWVGEYKFIE